MGGMDGQGKSIFGWSRSQWIRNGMEGKFGGLMDGIFSSSFDSSFFDDMRD